MAALVFITALAATAALLWVALRRPRRPDPRPAPHRQPPRSRKLEYARSAVREERRRTDLIGQRTAAHARGDMTAVRRIQNAIWRSEEREFGQPRPRHGGR